MPKLINRTPRYTLHRPTGRGRVTIDGRKIDLGVWGTPESREKYDRLVAQWLANGRRLPAPSPRVEAVTVAVVAAEFLRHARTYYRKPDGSPTGETDNHIMVATMVKVQLLTGMRPAEVCLMKAGEIDRTGPVWLYRPGQHKTQHHGHQRIIPIGPQAQELLAPYLSLKPDTYIFDPRASEARRLAELHAARKTPLSCGNRPGKRAGGFAEGGPQGQSPLLAADVRA